MGSYKKVSKYIETTSKKYVHPSKWKTKIAISAKTRLPTRPVKKEDKFWCKNQHFWFNNLICKMCVKILWFHICILKFAPFKYVWRLVLFDAQLNRLQLVLRLKFLKKIYHPRLLFTLTNQNGLILASKLIYQL